MTKFTLGGTVVGALIASAAASAQAPDVGALAAVNTAKPNACPIARVKQGARSEGFGPQRGVTIIELDTVPMKGEPARRVRLVRVTVAAGGIIGWHAHDEDQGMALLVSGSAVEVRNDCQDALTHRPGSIIKEYADTVHSFRNLGRVPAVFLVMHGLPQN